MSRTASEDRSTARPGLTLITGGARSGKSRFAQVLAARSPRPAFIATAEALDEEMRERIQRHRIERGDRFVTIEEPLDLASALGRIPAGCGAAAIDCLTVWLGNLLHHRPLATPSPELDDLPEAGALLRALIAPPCPLIVVTNEVGLGVIPESPLTRSYVDLLGRLNQEVAALADRVVLMVSGLPLAIKGTVEAGPA